MKPLFLFVLAGLLAFPPAPASPAPQLFATETGFEADKLASIWLIRRFIAPGARVLLHPRGEVVAGAIEFDSPDAELARKFNASSFESLLEHYGIRDEKLANIGRLIHDIEINVWERKVFVRTGQVEAAIAEIIERYPLPEEAMTEAGRFFDDLYRSLPPRLETSSAER